MKRLRYRIAIVILALIIFPLPCAQAYQCGDCHPVTQLPGSVIRNCKESGCHSTNDLDNGNHHMTAQALAGTCTACHDPTLVADYDENNPSTAEPTDLTPTVQSCNNCHKGHANPLDQNGDPYPFPIAQTVDLEHMAGLGPGTHVDDCLLCHPVDPPTHPAPIKQCETCHTVDTLHTIPGHAVTSPDPLPYDGYWYDENGAWTEITGSDRCVACHGAPPEPPPDTMLYVSQDMGTYDTTYSQLEEADCRACHGNTQERHHILFVPVVECTLVPDTVPTVVHPGETLGFQASVTNNTQGMGMVFFGTKVTKPDASQTGFVWGPLEVWLNPEQTKSGHKTHTIPVGFETGIYTYHGYVGRYGNIYDECHFEFEVVHE